MRTNIVIRDELMGDAMRLSGCKTKRETVERGLKTLINIKQQEALKAYRGSLLWQGDLEVLRKD